jgi:hypothetical protein
LGTHLLHERGKIESLECGQPIDRMRLLLKSMTERDV